MWPISAHLCAIRQARISSLDITGVQKLQSVTRDNMHCNKAWPSHSTPQNHDNSGSKPTNDKVWTLETAKRNLVVTGFLSQYVRFLSIGVYLTGKYWAMCILDLVRISWFTFSLFVLLSKQKSGKLWQSSLLVWNSAFSLNIYLICHSSLVLLGSHSNLHCVKFFPNDRLAIHFLIHTSVSSQSNSIRVAWG